MLIYQSGPKKYLKNVNFKEVNHAIMKKLSLITLSLFFSTWVLAQGDLDDLFTGSVDDAKKLSEGYITPFMKAFGYGMNQGWYNTAKPHAVPGFDLTITVSPIYVPDADRFYSVDNTQLNNITLTNTGSASVSASGKGDVPSFFGPDQTPTYQENLGSTSFSGPPGVDLKFLPVPMAALGIGLPKGFDLKIRFVPKIDLGNISDGEVDGQFNLFGIGVMHDVKQYIPGIKTLPFDLSGFVGYTKMKLAVGFDSANPDQEAVFESSATTIQGVISKKVAVLTFYGGLGLNIAKTKLAVNGDYDFDGNGSTEVSNPFSLEAASSGPRLTAGMRLKLAVFAFHADYTIQKYKALTVGFGINVR